MLKFFEMAAQLRIWYFVSWGVFAILLLACAILIIYYRWR